MRKEYASVYVDKSLQEEIAAIAKAEDRSIIGLLRVVFKIYKKLTPVERAHILERQIDR